MATTQPLVSIVVPCFNTGPYLPATLRSIAAQDFRDFELLLVDDGSGDDTLAVMQAFAAGHAGVKVIPMGRNQGAVAARNAALAQAEGTYVAMLDGDDLWTPDALSRRVAVARLHPGADVVASDFAWFVDEPAHPPVGKVGQGPRARKAFSSAFETGQPMLLKEPFELVATLHFAWTGATLVKRQAISAAGNFDPSFPGVGEDTLVWLRLARRGDFVFMPEITAYYRQRQGSAVTQLTGPKELNYLKVLDWVSRDANLAAQTPVIRGLQAECHHISAQYYRRIADHASACGHAWGAVKARPLQSAYWRSLVAAGLEACLRRRAG